MSRRLGPEGVHALAVRVANELLDDALDPVADLDLPTRRWLVALAAQVERGGARRAGVAPDGDGVLRAAARDLANIERLREHGVCG